MIDATAKRALSPIPYPLSLDFFYYWSQQCLQKIPFYM